MLGDYAEKLREYTGSCDCHACGVHGHRRDMHRLKDGYICERCMSERSAKANAEIVKLGLKSQPPNDVCLIRTGRRLFGGANNLEHVIEYDHRYICEKCGHFGVKKCKRSVHNDGRFHTSKTDDLCDECGSAKIWYIDVTDDDITNTYDNYSHGIYGHKSSA